MENMRQISRDARKRVVKDYFEINCVVSPFEHIDNYTDKNIKKDAQALCLYAALLWVGVDKASGLDCDFLARAQDREARRKLRERSKYANLNDADFESAVLRIISTEKRNCFAHGCLAVAESDLGEKYFVLRPERTVFESQENMYVSFQSVLGLVANYIQEKAQNTTDEGYFQNVEVPTLLLNLYSYYNTNEKKDSDEIDVSKFGKLLQTLEVALLCADFTWNESSYFEDYGKDSEIFNLISFTRNSLIHETLKISSDGRTIYIDNAKPSALRTHGEKLSSFVFKLMSADFVKDMTAMRRDFGIEIDEMKNALPDGFLDEDRSENDVLIAALEGLTTANENYTKTH